MLSVKAAWNGGKITPGKLGTRLIMAELGRIGEKTIKERASRCIGSDDLPMRPLSKGYAIKKSKQGKGNKPNLSYSGEMLNALSAGFATERGVRVSITTRHGRLAASGNEARSPWWGWSPKDVETIIRRAHELFRDSIADIGVVLRGLRPGRGFGSRARWLSEE